MPTISPTMLALLDRVSKEEVFGFKVQDEGVREATIFALKDRGLIVFGEYKPGAGRKLVVTTLGLTLLTHFSASPDSPKQEN
jgi:hypothetical protein